MSAVALHTQAGSTGATTSAATTNGPSSNAPTTGSGPVAAPNNQALLGERILPAPVGEPQAINLPDGSMLVPIARVDASGNRTPLAGGAGSAPLTGGGGSAAAAPAAGGAAGGVVHAAEGTQVTADGNVHAQGRNFEPHALLYNGNYYKKYVDGDTETNFGRFDINNRDEVEQRAVESTFMYLKDKEPEVDDFGVTGVNVRRVNQGADKDLLNVNPDAMWVINVHGLQGDGSPRSIPTVMNADGTTYTDPRLSGR